MKDALLKNSSALSRWRFVLSSILVLISMLVYTNFRQDLGIGIDQAEFTLGLDHCRNRHLSFQSEKGMLTLAANCLDCQILIL
jgi:hypothetical protein